MHVKTNIEHSPVQLIVLAMCPLLLAMSSVNDSIFFLSGTIICLIISQIFILLFNKYLNNDVKTLITALVSAMVITIWSIALKEFTDKTLPENAFLIVFSTMILNAEFIYFNNKALTKHYFFNILKIMLIFAIVMLMYSVLKEFMAFGSVYGKQLFEFSGFEFCKTIIFDLLWLASLCAISDFVVRRIDKVFESKNMVYQKYIRIIRTEKAFQYDKLRREKLLANEVEVNRINKSDSEKIVQKEAENESINSVKEVVSEEEEVSDVIAEEQKSEASSETKTESEKTGKKHKKKRKKEDKK